MKLSIKFFIFAALLTVGAYFVFFYSASESDQKSDPVASTQDTTLSYSQKEEDAAWEALINPEIKPIHHPNAVFKVLSADKDDPDQFKIKVTNMELLTHPVLEEEVVFHTGPEQSFAAQVDYIEITPHGNKIWTAIYKKEGIPFFSQVTVGENIVLSQVTDGVDTYHYSIDKSTGEGTLIKEDPSKILLAPETYSDEPQRNNAPAKKKKEKVHQTSSTQTHFKAKPKRG